MGTILANYIAGYLCLSGQTAGDGGAQS